jgi:hypothetical protein
MGLQLTPLLPTLYHLLAKVYLSSLALSTKIINFFRCYVVGKPKGKTGVLMVTFTEKIGTMKSRHCP